MKLTLDVAVMNEETFKDTGKLTKMETYTDDRSHARQSGTSVRKTNWPLLWSKGTAPASKVEAG